MALREQIMKDISDVPSDSQQSKDCTQENGAPDDRDSNTELSSSLLPPLSLRERRKRERENKLKPKEMTEEEMMDLALHLSKQEASITAIRKQQEEEAMMKAIQESMVSQTQPCVSLQSQSLLTGAGASLRLCSRRKLLYLNKEQLSEDSCLSETDLNGAKDESQSRSKKLKRRERSPLLEMPDLSQTQKISTQDSQSSLEPLELQLDSPESCDLTQIEDCKSPVFPSTSCRAEVQVHSLNPNPVDSCKTSGLVVFSQVSSDVTQKSPSPQPKSPTFPKSQKNCQELPLTRSPVFSEAEQGEDSDTQLSQDEFKSPVFGRTTQQNKALDTCRPQIYYSGLTSSSQGSLSSSVRATSCHPQSPVFPGSPAFHETDNARLSQFSETDELTDQIKICCPSPVFDRIENHSKIHLSELRHTEGPADINESSQSLKKCSKTNHNPDVTFKSDEAEDEIHKDCNTAEMELSSDMKLLWSDDDENDVTPAGSPSPVFPDEKTVQRTDSQAAPLFHVTAASPSINETNFSQQVTSKRDLQKVNSQETASSLSHLPQESPGGATVQYYWGVPFCPRGLDPDSYTQVILAQMDVYEKSLKTAQRFLLRKAEWGEAVLPQEEKPPSHESQSPESSDLDIPRRGGHRLRGKRLSEEDDNSPAIESKEGEEKMDRGEEQEKKQKEAEKKNGGGEEVYSDDCEVCPETQLSNNDEDDDQTQDLLLAPDPGEDLHSESPEQLDVDMLLRDDSPAVEEQPQNEEMELETEAPVDVIMKETSATGDVERENEDKEKPEEDHGDTCVEEMNGHRLQRSMSPELEPAVVPQRPETSVDCPICQGAFPTSEIEMHAAYCDGEVAVVHEKRPKPDLFQVSLKPRRKRIRRLVSREEEEALEASNCGKNQEKCYICQRAVPLREYSRHTELCIQRQGAKTSGKGNLLSALEQTDSRDSEAGPSGSKHQTGEVIELLDDDEEDEESSTATALRISNSPIRAFTPISEATDCLIDFKKQRRVKKTSQRRR